MTFSALEWLNSSVCFCRKYYKFLVALSISLVFVFLSLDVFQEISGYEYIVISNIRLPLIVGISVFISFFVRKLLFSDDTDIKNDIANHLRKKSQFLNVTANAILIVMVCALSMGFYLIVFDQDRKSQAEKTKGALENLSRFMNNRVSNIEDTDKNLKSIIEKINLVVVSDGLSQKEKLYISELLVDLSTEKSKLNEVIVSLGSELDKVQTLSGLRDLDAGFFEIIFTKIGIFIILIFSVRFLGNRSAELRNTSAVYQRNADFIDLLKSSKVTIDKKEFLKIANEALVLPKEIGRVENSTISDKIPDLTEMIKKKNGS